MSTVQIAFLGATETVTGSRFLITSDKSKILVDCGMFQGVKSDRLKNWDPFPVEPESIDAIVLSHAHLDHSGFLPVLVRDGFKGPIYSTHYTKMLTAVILRDSAHLQTEDAKYAVKKGYSKHAEPKALYGEEEVNKTLPLFSEVAYRTRTQLTEDSFVTFFPSGHILGSSFILLEVAGRKFLFTSDLGRNNHPILSDPDMAPTEGIDVVITESTYGDRKHETPESLFAAELNAAFNRGGTVLIPAFAVDRTEVILIKLRELIENKQIPNVPIYVDSPMALTALDYYREAVSSESHEIRENIHEKFHDQDPFDPGTLYQMRTTEESIKINEVQGNAIIISASGMATGGRVVHHLQQLLPDPKNTIMLVGFQAAGTRGRSLEEGQKQLKMYGQWIPVNAHIAKVESFSVHADATELVDWLKPIPRPQQVFVVHGEPDGQRGLKERLENQLNWYVTIPKSGQVFTIN
jgi:metallo-beta-lactamase family protein